MSAVSDVCNGSLQTFFPRCESVLNNSGMAKIYQKNKKLKGKTKNMDKRHLETCSAKWFIHADSRLNQKKNPRRIIFPTPPPPKNHKIPLLILIRMIFTIYKYIDHGPWGNLFIFSYVMLTYIFGVCFHV